MCLCGMIVINDRIISNRHDLFRFEQSDRFSEKIPSVQAVVRMPDLCGIIAVAVMIACINHGAFDAGEPYHLHIIFCLKPTHEFRLDIRNMIIDQKP